MQNQNKCFLTFDDISNLQNESLAKFYVLDFSKLTSFESLDWLLVNLDNRTAWQSVIAEVYEKLKIEPTSEQLEYFTDLIFSNDILQKLRAEPRDRDSIFRRLFLSTQPINTPQDENLLGFWVRAGAMTEMFERQAETLESIVIKITLPEKNYKQYIIAPFRSSQGLAMGDNIYFIENETTANAFLNRLQNERVISYCNNCENYFLTDSGYSDGFCSRDCRDYYEQDDEYSDDDESESSGWQYRGNTFTTKYQSQSKQSSFGVEIETIAPDYETRQNVSDAIRKTLSDFSIVSDGSLGDCGFEVVSPVLKGKKGFSALQKLCNILAGHNCQIDKSCGLHIHIGGKDIIDNQENIKNLLRFYAVFEDVILSFLPNSRQKNTFANLVSRGFDLSELDTTDIEKFYYKTKSDREIEQAKGEHYHPSRYYGLNLHSLFTNQHYEIRYHSGTINFEKIKNWVELHLAIKDTIKSLNVSTIKINFAEKTKSMFDLLGLPKRVVTFYQKRQKLFSRTFANQPTEN